MEAYLSLGREMCLGVKVSLCLAFICTLQVDVSQRKRSMTPNYIPLSQIKDEDGRDVGNI